MKRLLCITGALVGIIVFVVVMGALLAGILRNVSDLQEMAQLNHSKEAVEQPSRERCQHALYIYCSSCESSPQQNRLYLELILKKYTENERADFEGDITASRPPRAPLVHDIVYGETLSSISQLYGVSVDAIVAYNEIRNVNRIYAGSALQIPGVFVGCQDTN